MPDLTPAGELRAAAERVRAAALTLGITPPPWLSMDRGDRIVHDPGHDDDPPVYVVDEPVSNAANAEWIALMDPEVGVALARVLSESAVVHLPVSECRWCDPATNPARLACPELAVARAINTLEERA